ncbi:hypothetical protein COTS27_01606 [Spirochaetota bacterium]|nr:hypothetical protein COTS27_01606 [Spirochaetota bacterium]
MIDDNFIIDDNLNRRQFYMIRKSDCVIDKSDCVIDKSDCMTGKSDRVIVYLRACFIICFMFYAISS